MAPSADCDGYVLAFDFGLRHIGVAGGQTVTGTAGPLTTLTAERGRPRWPELLELVAEWRPVRLLVGLPLNMDGTGSDMSEAARKFARALEQRSGIATELVDERLSTRAAQALARSDSGSRAGSHELAAVLIAETWFAERRGAAPPRD